MQVAGSTCFVCEKSVGTIPDAVGCRRCQKVAHRACGLHRTCPICQGDLVPGSVLHAAAAPVHPIEQMEPGDPDGTDEPQQSGLAGSLAVFVVWITAVVVVQIVQSVLRAANATTETERFIAMMMVGAGIYGGWCVRALRDANPRAPRHVHGWLGLTSVLSVTLGAVSGSLSGAGAPVLAWMFVALYLAKSKRVAAVYRAGA
jgi:hypothetical protein